MELNIGTSIEDLLKYINSFKGGNAEVYAYYTLNEDSTIFDGIPVGGYEFTGKGSITKSYAGQRNPQAGDLIIIHYQEANVNGQDTVIGAFKSGTDGNFNVQVFAFLGGASFELVQETGDSTTAVMSQKAVTEALANAGGGGGGTSNIVFSLQNTTGWLFKSIAENASCVLSARWSSTESEISTGDGLLTIKVDNIVKYVGNVSQGDFTIEVGSYLTAGSNTVQLIVADTYGNSRYINYTIDVIAISLSSTFDGTKAYTGSINYVYTPVGNVSKVVHFILDGTEIEESEPITTSGRQQGFTIPQQTHGAHSFEVYFVAEVNGETITSNKLYYDLICYESGNSTPIIASVFNRETVSQYENVTIPYIVYSPNSLTSEVILQADGVNINELTVDRTVQSWIYRTDVVGEVELKIICGITSRIFNPTVVETEISVEAVTDNLELYLSSYGRSNNEENKDIWEYNDIKCSFTGYNWVSDGWQIDDDGITVHRVSGDARLTIPLQVFKDDFRGTGKTIEIEFATRNILNYNAIVASCYSGSRGFQITAQKTLLKSEQSTIATQYKEDEHIRLTFVVEKRAENRLIYIYLNGIMSGVAQYPTDDDFSQTNPVGISIGSNECTIDLYTIRVYNNNLTRYEVVENWIADTQKIEDKIDRFVRNNVYNAYGDIIIENLPTILPYLILEAETLPEYKGNKVTVNGRYVDKVNTDKSFTFENAEADVQGTSSAGYARKNYKIKFKNGFEQDGEVAEGYKLRDNSIPIATFTFKADVASSEGANNVELVRLYNAICPYKTPPQLLDARVRQGIDGLPIVIFHNDGTSTTFVGKYNFNNDKGTPEVFGFASGDQSWEILNNTSNRVLFKSANFTGDAWKSDFEARYPEDYENPEKLAEFVSWVVSTNQETATYDTLDNPIMYGETTYTMDTPEYRLAKFKAELAQYANVTSAVFYYLFTELFLMVDSRAKNAFPTWFDGDKVCWLPYDMDTALGINNEGSLVFSYELEDIDKTSSGANIYNGQQSVFWINLRQAFADEIKAMYQKLRSDDVLSYDIVENAFEEHQDVWCEAVWNEDAYYKYLQPLIDDGTGIYLPMLQGSKSEQRKWWLYNRFRYIDSKYNAGDALTDFITLRGYAKDDISVEPYADIYATVKYGSVLVQKRALRTDEKTTLECPLDTLSDTEIYIYSASQLKSVGDLSGLKVGLADFSMATKLQELKVGSSEIDYTNGNLLTLTLGNNILLKTVDARNCTNLGTGEQQTIDLSGCINVEEVYFDNTAVKGVKFHNGGILKVLHLPETVTNLTLLNQSSLTSFTMPTYENISTLRLENISDSVVPARTILNNIQANSRVRLIGVNWNFESATQANEIIDVLETMRGLDENDGNMEKVQISGTFHITALTGEELAELEARFPYVKYTYDNLTSFLYYMNEDGSQELHRETIVNGGDGTGYTASKESTAQYDYVFTGWSLTPNGTVNANALKDVEADRYVYAVFTAYLRTYTVKFYNGDTLLQTVLNVPYGGSATYTGDTPTNDNVDFVFKGWRPDGTNITGDTDCYAQWSDASSKTLGFVERTIKIAESDSATSICPQAFDSCEFLISANFPNATSIGNSSFVDCSSLTTIDFPNVTSIGSRTFYNCKELTIANFPNVTSGSNSMFYDCKALTRVDLQNVEAIGSAVCQNCHNLSYANFASATSLAYSVFEGAYALTTVIIGTKQTTVATLSSSVFKYCYRFTGQSAIPGNPQGLHDGYIYVPASLVEAYRVATNWSEYATRIMPYVATVAELANIDGTKYDKACVGTDYTEYTYNGTSWEVYVR